MKNEKNADYLMTEIKEKGHHAYKLKVDMADKGIWFFVRVGTFESKEKAQQMQLQLAETNIQSIVLKQ